MPNAQIRAADPCMPLHGQHCRQGLQWPPLCAPPSRQRLYVFEPQFLAIPQLLVKGSGCCVADEHIELHQCVSARARLVFGRRDERPTDSSSFSLRRHNDVGNMPDWLLRVIVRHGLDVADEADELSRRVPQPAGASPPFSRRSLQRWPASPWPLFAEHRALAAYRAASGAARAQESLRGPQS